MYKKQNNKQLSFNDFDQPWGLKMDPNDRWLILANLIPWHKYEKQYASLFPSQTGQVAKPFREALGSLIIQKKLGFSDRELVQEITENPYLQYFIGLPGYQNKPPFNPSELVFFRKRIDLEMIMKINENLLKQVENGREHDAQGKKQKEQNSDDDDDHHHAGAATTGNNHQDETTKAKQESNKGTLIIDATCAPADVRYPQDFSLLNEAREKLEKMIRRICHKHSLPLPRTYCRQARKNYLTLAKHRRRPRKLLRQTIRKQLSYVRRDLGYVKRYLAEDYELTVKENRLYSIIQTLYQQQLIMYQNKTHRIKDRIISLTQPYLRPIVRGKAKAPVEFGVKFDLSLDEQGYGRIEKISFDPYNEASTLPLAAETYRRRTGHYPERLLADQIYRNRKNRRYCKEKGIRLSGPRLGRPSSKHKLNLEARRVEYQDNTDRIEIERSFSLSKRCYSLGLIRDKSPETTCGAVGLSIFVTNLFKALQKQGLLLPKIQIYYFIYNKYSNQSIKNYTPKAIKAKSVC